MATFRRFADVFEQFDDNDSTLRVLVERVPNPAITLFHLNRRLAADGRSIELFTDTGKLIWTTSSGEKIGLTQPQRRLIAALRAIQGAKLGARYATDWNLSSFSLQIWKSPTEPDERFERAVIAALAENLGVATDDIMVAIDDTRKQLAYSRFSIYDEEVPYLED